MRLHYKQLAKHSIFNAMFLSDEINVALNILFVFASYSRVHGLLLHLPFFKCARFIIKMNNRCKELLHERIAIQFRNSVNVAVQNSVQILF